MLFLALTWLLTQFAMTGLMDATAQCSEGPLTGF